MARTHKRSWRNLLLNRRYQLRFTALLVGGASVALLGLGYWVLSFSRSATVIAESQLQSQCIEAEAPTAEEAASFVDSAKPADLALADGAPSARTRRVVTVASSAETLPPDLVSAALARWECRLAQAAGLRDVRHGLRTIFWTLLGLGFVLLALLALWGIKLTHKVAGPLHKVSQYFAQMREGRLGPTYPLRRGDQLVGFYEHFRHAHSALRERERATAAALRDVSRAFAGTSGVSATISEADDLATEKEKSIE